MNLVSARRKKGKPQWDLRKSTGLHQTKISLIERGYIIPKEFEKERIARALDIYPNEIEWGKGNDE